MRKWLIIDGLCIHMTIRVYKIMSHTSVRVKQMAVISR